jgi:hypothetical protein
MVQVLAPAVLLALAQELLAPEVAEADGPMPQCWTGSR